MMEKDGFEIILSEAPEIPLEVEKEIVKRGRNWYPKLATPAVEVLAKFTTSMQKQGEGF